MRRWVVITCVLLGAAAGVPGEVGAAGVATAGAVAPPVITLVPSSHQILSGQSVTLSGRVSGAAAGTVLSLYASPYPDSRAPLQVATTTTAADGSFSFTVSPDRDTRYAAAATAVGPSESVVAVVDVISARPSPRCGRCRSARPR
jgi:hypothetical protein